MSTPSSISRRTAIAAIGFTSAGLTLTAPAAASRMQGPMADHPLVGAWLVMLTLATSPDAPVVVTSIYTADGYVFHTFPVAEAGQRGVTLKGTAMGVWEAVDEHTGHFTTVQVLAGAEGAFAGTLTVDGYPKVSDDGATFEDANPDGHATIRNASNEIVADIPGGSPEPVRGYRIMPGNVTFPAAGVEATPVANSDSRLPHETA